jgi:hypothetical protein
MSKELEELIDMREKLVERGQPTEAIDRRIASERARLMRTASDRPAGPARAVTLEITASRKSPQEQSARIVEDGRKPTAVKKPADKPAKNKPAKK